MYVSENHSHGGKGQIVSFLVVQSLCETRTQEKGNIGKVHF